MEKKEKMSLNSIFEFGKYKGKKLSDILKSNPGYLKWCLDKNFFNLSQLEIEEIKEVEQKQEPGVESVV